MFSGEDGSEHVPHLPLLPLDCDAPGIDRRIFRQRSLVEGTFSPFRLHESPVSLRFCLSVRCVHLLIPKNPATETTAPTS